MSDDPNDTTAPMTEPTVIEITLADTLAPVPDDEDFEDGSDNHAGEPVAVTVTTVAGEPLEPPIRETVVLETDHGRTIVHVGDWMDAKQPFLLLQGVSWHHKTEDAEGRWVYRKD